MNRMGFRYIPAGVVPSNGILTCHTIETTPACFRVSWEDRSPFVKVTKDGLGLLGDKGFRSARLNVPIREGNWFMEVKIERGGGEHTSNNNQPEGSHVRLGWGTDLDGFVRLVQTCCGMKQQRTFVGYACASEHELRGWRR